MDSIEQLKQLAGIDTLRQASRSNTTDHRSVLEKKEYELEHNIKPGTNEWFDLWFSCQDSLNMPTGFRGRRK